MHEEPVQPFAFVEQRMRDRILHRQSGRRAQHAAAQRVERLAAIAEDFQLRLQAAGRETRGSAFNASASASASTYVSGKPSASSGSPSVAAKLNSTSRSSSIRYGIR